MTCRDTLVAYVSAVAVPLLCSGCTPSHCATCTCMPSSPSRTADALHAQIEVLVLALDVQPDCTVADVLLHTASTSPLTVDSWDLARAMTRIVLRDDEGEIWQIRDVRLWAASGGAPPDTVHTHMFVVGAHASERVGLQGVLVPLTADRVYAVLPRRFGVDELNGSVEAFVSGVSVGPMSFTVVERARGTIVVQGSGWRVFEDE